MKQTRTRILSLLMALIMCLGLLPVTALAASGSSGEPYLFLDPNQDPDAYSDPSWRFISELSWLQISPSMKAEVTITPSNKPWDSGIWAGTGNNVDTGTSPVEDGTVLFSLGLFCAQKCPPAATRTPSPNLSQTPSQEGSSKRWDRYRLSIFPLKKSLKPL